MRTLKSGRRFEFHTGAFAAKDADARTKALERRLAASAAALDKKTAELAKVRETVDDLDVFRLDAVAHQLKKLDDRLGALSSTVLAGAAREGLVKCRGHVKDSVPWR
jgi:uncharacterized coiled-coil protein SlyX